MSKPCTKPGCRAWRERALTAEDRLSRATDALMALVIVSGREIGYRTMHNIPMQMAKSIESKVRRALATKAD